MQVEFLKTNWVCTHNLNNFALHKRSTTIKSTWKSTLQNGKSDSNFFFFSFLEFVLRVLGYPKALVVECVEPDNYFQNWEYGSWLTGIWNRIDEVIECLSPGIISLSNLILLCILSNSVVMNFIITSFQLLQTFIFPFLELSICQLKKP